VTAAVALASVSASRPCFADEVDAPPARAEALFREAKKLMADQAYDKACPMLEESQRLDPGGGTLLTLALCHEAQGKTASAWSEFNDALARALVDGRGDRAAIARSHAAALEPHLARLTVRLAASVAGTTGVEVRCDDRVLPAGAWAVPIPVDPGKHRVDVSAPGKRSFTADATAVAEETVAVEVAELADVDPTEHAVRPLSPEPPAPPRAAPPRAASLLDARGISGIVFLGVGAVITGGAVYFGAHAIAVQAQADKTCPMAACHDPNAVGLNGVARTSARFSTAGFVAGGSALVAGGFLLLWPRAPKPVSGLVVAPQKGGAALTASGTF
jgi:hypothetical protein